jgi:hypothetical protein
MIFSMAIKAAAMALLVTAQTPQTAPSSEWNLRRNVGNGACSVQPAENTSQLGALVATHPSRKEACEDAKTRHADDASDKNKCTGYTNNTKDECKTKEGVDLTQ